MKKFIKKLLPFILFILVLEVAIPIAVDPYNVFHWNQIRDNGVEPNSNYIKMQYVLSNPDKFDSFLFGSSRTGFVNVEHIDDGGSWYNMSYSEGLPAEHLDNLEELIANGIIPKTVMIGVDNISCFVDPALHASQFYRIPYPRTGRLSFYANYLSIKGVLASLDVILNYEPTDPDYVERYYRSGDTVKDPSLAGDFTEAPYWDDYYTDYMSKSVDDIRAIANLCEEYEIRLILFSNPLYYRTYQYSVYYGYDTFLDWLIGAAGEFYNFSGVNDVTENRAYYYESSHYTEEVGDMIIDRIFHGAKEDTLESQGFGMLVSAQNRDEFMEILAEQ